MTHNIMRSTLTAALFFFVAFKLLCFTFSLSKSKARADVPNVQIHIWPVGIMLYSVA